MPVYAALCGGWLTFFQGFLIMLSVDLNTAVIFAVMVLVLQTLDGICSTPTWWGAASACRRGWPWPPSASSASSSAFPACSWENARSPMIRIPCGISNVPFVDDETHTSRLSALLYSALSITARAGCTDETEIVFKFSQFVHGLNPRSVTLSGIETEVRLSQ